MDAPAVHAAAAAARLMSQLMIMTRAKALAAVDVCCRCIASVLPVVAADAVGQYRSP